MPTSRLDFLKALVKSGRACRNSITSRKADGVSTHHIRTKTTHGANSKKVGRYSVVRSCGCTLKGMVLGLEGCLVGCAHGSNKTQHRDRINLEVTQSLNQTYGRCIDFLHALDEFFWVLTNDECVHLGQSWFQHIWRVGQFASLGTLRNSPRSAAAEIHVLQCHTETSSICDSSN